jgi:ABC-type dipeptide/oligopeptide/nickel transport system ATPase subunit
VRDVARGRRTVLCDVSLSLAPGRSLAVLGESGAGRSTLIAAVLGLLRPAAGRIALCGAPVGVCRPALVMQEPRAAFNPVLPLRRSVLEPLGARAFRSMPNASLVSATRSIPRRTCSTAASARSPSGRRSARASCAR